MGADVVGLTKVSFVPSLTFSPVSILKEGILILAGDGVKVKGGSVLA